MKRARLSLQAAWVLLPLVLAGCEAASSLKGAGYSTPNQTRHINAAFKERDECLAKNVVPSDANNSSAETIARAAALVCQPETERLIALSNPYSDPRITAAIQKDSDFRALGYVLKARRASE